MRILWPLTDAIEYFMKFSDNYPYLSGFNQYIVIGVIKVAFSNREIALDKIPHHIFSFFLIC